MKRRRSIRSRMRAAEEQVRTPPFARRVYQLVCRIPRGRVLTYGRVAELLGAPRSARAVGTALATLPRALVEIVPWQRVVNSAGGCSQRGDFWAETQRELLEVEGVRFDRHGKVDLRRTSWPGPRAVSRRGRPRPTPRASATPSTPPTSGASRLR